MIFHLYSNDIFIAVDICHMVWFIDYESSTHWQLIAQLYTKIMSFKIAENILPDMVAPCEILLDVISFCSQFVDPEVSMFIAHFAGKWCPHCGKGPLSNIESFTATEEMATNWGRVHCDRFIILVIVVLKYWLINLIFPYIQLKSIPLYLSLYQWLHDITISCIYSTIY